MGMAQGKGPAMSLIFSLQLTTDYTFKMRYIALLNSRWFQKYKPLKLKEQNVNLSM